MAETWLAPDVRRLLELLPDRGAAAARALRLAITEPRVPPRLSHVRRRPARSPARADRAVVVQALTDARRRRRADPSALRYVASLLLRPGPLGALGAFVRRFQQASGALMAKGVEDTALYRWLPLVSRNEVGADPSVPTHGAVARLHGTLAVRARRFPAALSAVTTHDTKRSADTRARLHLLAEMPDRWTAAVARWRDRHRAWRRRVDGRRLPDATTEYLVYQTALALWDGTARAERVRDRVRAYVQKALREAAVDTSWLDPVPAVEEAVDAFVVAVFASWPFRDDLTALASTIARPALWTALARTLVHLTAPGIPDLYQGDELWRVLLVDPDNRGDVDCTPRHPAGRSRAPPRRRPSSRARSSRDRTTARELHAIRVALGSGATGRRLPRRLRPARSRHGPDAPRRGVRAHRRHAGAITVVKHGSPPSLMGVHPDARSAPACGATPRSAPTVLARRRWTNVLTSETLGARAGSLRVKDALAEFPVALLWSS
jgi:(1->4)-alpha-D-glucan 1-alpha-D-glucosylmutase